MPRVWPDSARRVPRRAPRGLSQISWGRAEREGVAAAAQAHRKQGDTDGAGLPPGVLTVCREIYQEGGLQVRCWHNLGGGGGGGGGGRARARKRMRACCRAW